LDPEEAVSGAAMVIIATPIGDMPRIAPLIAPFLARGCVVMDTGSSKRRIVGELERIVSPHAHFVGAHPIAGSERSGMGAARHDLFDGATCVLTPTRRTDRHALKLAADFWKNLGSRVVILSPAEHDRVLAAMSHLPHLLAAALVNSLTRLFERGGVVAGYAGPGFRDSTRIAAGPAEMWVDISMANRDEILRALEAYHAELKGLKEALRRKDAASLNALLSRASRLRQAIG
jgi:prephenate dehydrogenase